MYRLYWGDSHLNLHSRDRDDFELAFRAARDHLDFLPIAYYPMEYYVTASGLSVESWHNRPQFLKEWGQINDLCRKYNVPGEFVTFPGYEWHGNRTRWGDHNVYYFAEGHSLDDTDDIDDLYRSLRAKRGLAIPHHVGYMLGQRAKDWDHFDPNLSPFAEIYSAHGSSETPVNRFPQNNVAMGPWTSGSTIVDALARGLRVGIISSGDNHRRYAGVYGNGLMGVWASELTREALWEAFLSRHVYGVTGDRIAVRYQVNDAHMGSEIAADGPVTARFQIECPQALDRIEWIRNNRVFKTYCHQDDLPVDTSDPVRCRLRIEPGWGPLAKYGFEEVAKHWQGSISLSEGRISIVQGCWTDFGNRLAQQGDRTVGFHTHTATAQRHSSQALAVEVVAPHVARRHTEPDPFAMMAQRYPTQAFIVEITAPRAARVSIEAEPLDVSFNLEEALSHTQLWADLPGCQRSIKVLFGLSVQDVENPDIYFHHAHKLRVVQAVPESAFRAEVKLVDPHPPSGRNWYYARISQTDGQMAWTSPVWVDQR